MPSSPLPFAGGSGWARLVRQNPPYIHTTSYWQFSINLARSFSWVLATTMLFTQIKDASPLLSSPGMKPQDVRAARAMETRRATPTKGQPPWSLNEILSGPWGSREHGLTTLLEHGGMVRSLDECNSTRLPCNNKTNLLPFSSSGSAANVTTPYTLTG